LFQENLKFIPVEPAFVGITRPTVEEGILSLIDRGIKKIVVFPYMLFAGRLVEKVKSIATMLKERFPANEIFLANHLGVSQEIQEVLADRIGQAVRGESGRLQCDNCDYRISSGAFPQDITKMNFPLHPVMEKGIYENVLVGFGEQKLPLNKHVLVCCGPECISRGSMVIMEKLKEELRRTGEGKRIKVTGTSRLDFCQFGPTLTIYPEGVWYGQVKEYDIPEIVEKHLLGNHVVNRLMF
jgi:(2Fe-2S) ferredoxin